MGSRVIVVSDTHMPRFGRTLPAPLVEGLHGTDLILHLGDITEGFVIDQLAEFAPVHAVAGNNDPPELAHRLGYTRVVEIEGLRVGMTHGHQGPGRTTPQRACRTFETVDPPVDVVCFGHSHQPLIEAKKGLWLLNPGSPTDRRRQPTFSYLRVEIEGRELRAFLVRYGTWR